MGYRSDVAIAMQKSDMDYVKCDHCGTDVADHYFSVIVDDNGTTELWCRDCVGDCAWTCSKCFEPYSYDVSYDINDDYEHICIACRE